MAEREPLRWGVIPLVDGRELLRAEGPSRKEPHRPIVMEITLHPADEQAHERHWRIELQREGEEPRVNWPTTLSSALSAIPPERREWAVRQTLRWLDELAARARDVLLGGLYVEAMRVMREFQAHMRELDQVEEADDRQIIDRLLDREPRTVPLDDHSHGPVCLALTETPDGMVEVHGLRAEDNQGVPMVTVKDSDTHADPFTVRLVTPEMADALWAAVYGARVVVWGEPTPFHGRS